MVSVNKCRKYKHHVICRQTICCRINCGWHSGDWAPDACSTIRAAKCKFEELVTETLSTSPAGIAYKIADPLSKKSFKDDPVFERWIMTADGHLRMNDLTGKYYDTEVA